MNLNEVIQSNWWPAGSWDTEIHRGKTVCRDTGRGAWQGLAEPGRIPLPALRRSQFGLGPLASRLWDNTFPSCKLLSLWCFPAKPEETEVGPGAGISHT